MTNEEREKLTRIRLETLVKDLHRIAEDEDENDPYISTRCQFAAKEIKRLAEDNRELQELRRRERLGHD